MNHADPARNDGIRRIGTLIAAAIVVFWVVYFPCEQASYAMLRGNQLTELFDPYSEANSIRAGEAFAVRGFSYNKGLPEVGFGHAFENQGGKYDTHLCATPQHCVYLHSPPGPDLLVGAATKMCGAGEVACFRVIPILVGFVALAFFAWAASRAFGLRRTAFVLSTFHFVPMITNGMHNLYHHGYVVSFLLVQIGILMLALLNPTRSTRFYAIALAVVGFVVGWFSYEQVLHITLIGLTLVCLTRDWRGDLNKTLVFSGAALGGFLLAGVLHLVQVADYLGGFAAAYEDFAQRAASRAGVGSQIEVLPPMGRLHLLLIYWMKFLREPQFYGGQFLAVSAATFAALLPRRPVGFRPFGIELEWAPPPMAKWGFLLAFLIPDVWIVVMRQHATVHGHFLPRSFIITFLVGAILLAASLRRKAQTQTPEEQGSGSPAAESIPT